jgi:hypothetical protein
MDDHRPDPTELTTQALWREISALKELFNSRLEAMQRAIDVAHDDLVRVPTEVMKAVGTLRDQHEEKFKTHEEKFKSVEQHIKDQAALRNERFDSVQKQLEERDVRSEQASRDDKVAISAAFAAQEKIGEKQTEAFSESIGKSEAGFTKQIDQIGARITDLTKTFDDKIDGLKQRLDRGEGRGEGQVVQRGFQQTTSSFTLAIIVALIGVAALLISIYNALKP